MTQREAYPADVRAALATFLTHDARFVRLLREEAETNLGDDGVEALTAGLRQYGAWAGARALTLARHSERHPLLLSDMFLHWGAGEIGVGGESPWAAISAETDVVRLTVTDTPVMRHFESHQVGDLTGWYYSSVLSAAADLVGADQPHCEINGGSLTLAWPVPGAQVASETGREVPFQRLVLNTAQGRGALMAFTGRQLLQRYGATGEYCLRTAISRFGTERGELLRQDVLAKSLDLNIENIITNYDSGGHTSVWQWAPGGELSPTKQFQDCTYCPFIPVWTELDAMDVGRIYDYEFHVAQFRAYNPAIRLKWDAIQTEGADHCAFRFSLPVDR